MSSAEALAGDAVSGRRSALVEAAVLALRRAGRPLALTQLARQVLHVESGPVDAGCRSLEPRLAADDRLQRDGVGQWALAEWSRRGSPIDDVEFVVFDLETNGGHGGRHRILEVGAERVRGGVVLARYDSLVRISGRVSRFVTRYTGITAGMLEGAPPIERVLDEFREFQDGAVLVAHNLPTDLGHLNREAVWASRPLFPGDGLDTMELIAALAPQVEALGLSAALAALGIEESPSHRALADAQVTAKLLLDLLERARQRDVTTLEALRALAAQAGPEGRMPRRAKELARWASRNLPPAPGVYMFREPGGRTLYVGKTVSLQRRVRSHFTDSDGFLRRQAGMVEQIERIDWETTGSELAALTREAELIEQLAPLYNVQRQWREGTRFIRIGPPAAAVVTAARADRDDDGDYAGPYRTSRDARLVARAVRRIFGLPSIRSRDKRVAGWRRDAGAAFISRGRDAALAIVQGARAPQTELDEVARRLRASRVVRRPIRGGLGGGQALLVTPGAEPNAADLALVEAGGVRAVETLDRPGRADVRRAMAALLDRADQPDRRPTPTECGIVLAWLHLNANRRELIPLDGPGQDLQLLDRVWTIVRAVTRD